nr:trypsin-like serine protease [Salinispora arenicola]
MHISRRRLVTTSPASLGCGVTRNHTGSRPVGWPRAGAVTGGISVPDGTHSFTAKINFGGIHACSGALIEPSWVVTAKSCFAEGTTPVVAGVPTQPTTVVIGRTDLTASTGYEAPAVSIIPHPDRNLALVRLSGRAAGSRPFRSPPRSRPRARPSRFPGTVGPRRSGCRTGPARCLIHRPRRRPLPH